MESGPQQNIVPIIITVVSLLEVRTQSLGAEKQLAQAHRVRTGRWKVEGAQAQKPSFELSNMEKELSLKLTT